jgi:hypothetical protein
VTGSPASFGEARLWGAGCPKQALRLRHPLGVGHRRHRSSAAPLGSSNRRSPLGGQCCWLNPHRPVSTRLGEKSLQPVAAHRPGFRASTGVSARKACVYGTEAQRFESSRARSKKFRLRRGIRAGAERPVVAAEPRRAPAVRRLADEPARTQRTSERPLGRERADAAARRTRRRRGRGSPRAECGRAFEFKERRFTRQELARLLNEIPPKWRPLFDLLAETGLRISEALGLLERPRARLGRAAAASQPRGSSRGGRSPEVPSRGANRAAAV